jgi:SHS2 domain-containing protein
MHEGYEYLEDIALADIAFRAWARTLPALLREAWDATLGVLIDDPAQLQDTDTHTIALTESDPEALLHSFLEELVFLKDAERFLGRIGSIHVEQRDGACIVNASIVGEVIDPARHRLGVEVKAITMHRLSLRRAPGGWEAVVVLDV